MIVADNNNSQSLKKVLLIRRRLPGRIYVVVIGTEIYFIVLAK